MTSAYLSGVGIIAPGLSGWEQARPVLAGERPYVAEPYQPPAPQILPPTERRRAGGAVRLALSVAQQAIEHAGMQASEVATVFATADGDADNMHALCETLAGEDRQVSPTRFHNSVQNAPAGYWTIAAGCRAGSNTISAPYGVAGQGLVEAVAQSAAEQRAVMLVAYDLPMPEPLAALRPVQPPCGIALLFTPSPLAGSLGLVKLELVESTRQPPLTDKALEQLRRSSDVGRLLSLLVACANSGAAEVEIDYLPGRAVRATHVPLTARQAA